MLSFVTMGSETIVVGNVVVLSFVSMATINIAARNVMGGAIASMTKIKSSARIVVVTSCARPHIVLQKKKKCDGHCLFCFVHLFPDKPVARKYKTQRDHS